MQTGIDGVHVATIYHDWFRGDPDENRPKGQTSAWELANVLVGRIPLPSGADLILDLNTIPDPLDKQLVVPWPTWTIRLLQDGVVVVTDVLSRDHPEGTIFRIQAPDTEGSVWNRSLGYRLILKGLVVNQRLILKGLVVNQRSSMTVDAYVGDWHAQTLVFPWVSRA